MPAQAVGKLFEPRRGLRGIEQRAAACLKRCRRKLGLSEIPLPIPVEEWIEGPLGIRFGVEDLTHLGQDVLGGTFIREREIIVSEKALAHEGRFRFTCAHELGHLILHGKLQATFRDLQDYDPFAAGQVERQADRFAGAFLMPIPLVERALLQICTDRKLHRRTCLVEIMLTTAESEFLWRTHFLPEITRRFNVSLAAALIRCRDLRLRNSDDRPLLSPVLADRLREPMRAEGSGNVVLVEGKPKKRNTSQELLF